MAKKNRTTIDPKELNGISIYPEEKRTVYSPFFSKKGYILTSDNVRQYQSYIQGYLGALVVFVLAYLIYKNLTVSLILALLFMISTAVTFYFNFIKKANFIDNYNKPHRDSFAVRQASYLSTKQIWTIIICCPLLALAIMLNSYLNHYTGFMFYMMVIISIVSVLYELLHIYILKLKKDNYPDE